VTSSFLAACIFIGGSVSRAEQLTVIPSDQANKSAYVTNKGIRWYTSLEDAETEAKKEGKLVFWLHMLGTIDGST
jgi:hypothetical protein